MAGGWGVTLASSRPQLLLSHTLYMGLHALAASPGEWSRAVRPQSPPASVGSSMEWHQEYLHTGRAARRPDSIIWAGRKHEKLRTKAKDVGKEGLLCGLVLWMQ